MVYTGVRIDRFYCINKEEQVRAIILLFSHLLSALRFQCTNIHNICMYYHK